MKKRLVISLLFVNAVVLAACGSGSEPLTGPRVIVAGNAASATRDAANTEAGASDMPARAFDVTYEPVDGLIDSLGAIDPTATHPSWEFLSPAEPRQQLQRVLDSLGTGPMPKVRAQSGNPGGYAAIAQDGPSFTSYGNEASRWWYYTADGTGEKDVAVSPPCAPDTKECGGTWTTVPPTRNLPGVDAATERTKVMLARMGVDTSTLRITGNKDDWNTSVYAVFELDGVATPMSWNFTFGENGRLTGAGGPVFSVRKGDNYPVITVGDAITRLNSRAGFGRYASSSISRGESIPSPVDVSTGITVQLTSVRISSMVYWTGTGQTLMLPAYAFGTDNAGTVEVLAVPDRFITEPDVAAPGTAGSEGGASGGSGGWSPGSIGSGAGAVEPTPAPDTPAGAPTMESAQKLLGLSLTEAQKVAESAGWVLRVVRMDGTDLSVTMDWNLMRVNVAVEKKIVTSVVAIN